MRLWIIAVLLLAAVIAQAGESSDSTSERITKVELTLKAEHDIYRMSDTLQMEIRLSNSGSKDVYIWEKDMCWNPARGLSMRITTSAGKYVQSPALLDCLRPPPAAGDAYQFVKISPRTFYGHVHRFKVSDLVDKPGEYTLRVHPLCYVQQFLVCTLYCGNLSTRANQQTVDYGHAHDHLESHPH